MTNRKQTFVIFGKLPSLNEYIRAERSGYHAANRMKHNYQNVIECDIRRFKIKAVNCPIRIIYCFYEENTRRDKDNISSIAHKFIQDALVNSGIIQNDGWKQIDSYLDYFYVDSQNPRIEVTLCPVRTKK